VLFLWVTSPLLGDASDHCGRILIIIITPVIVAIITVAAANGSTNAAT
jgi:hypothetical protein